MVQSQYVKYLQMIRHYFSKINGIDTSNIDISYDFVKISRWAYQRKISFNPDIIKQAAEVYFS